MYLEEAGQGEAVVLLHAGVADSRMWDPQFEPLSRSYRTVRYDRRGFGRTRTVTTPFSHRSDLGALLDRLGIARAHLVGCSQGARIALDFALEAAERVRSLTLISPALGGFRATGPCPRQVPDLEAADAADDVALFNELEVQVWADGPYRDAQQVDPAYRALVADMNRITLELPPPGPEQDLERPAAGRLGELRCPVLIVCGTLDQPRALEAAQFLRAGVPQAGYAELEAAHLPSLERPEAFTSLLLEFLNDH
nr:alpha/beta fold hydrolase [Deinobacterium chartae]